MCRRGTRSASKQRDPAKAESQCAAALGRGNGGHQAPQFASAVFELGQFALVFAVADLHVVELDLHQIEQRFNRVLGNGHGGIPKILVNDEHHSSVIVLNF